jgi:Na+-transporting methylmalonyl-CoA/oxaloacetate decarboxylase gamma subunit
MRTFLKFGGIALAILLLILLVAVIAAPTQFSAERSVEIDRPADEVFEFVKYLRNQNKYSVWGALDPDMVMEYRGTDGTVGFVSAWAGNEEAGRGEQEITGIQEGERIDYELRFYEPFESTSYAFKTTEALSESRTRVTWGMYGEIPRPLNLLMLFMNLEEAIGEDYQTGLNNLKTLLEQHKE